MAYTRNTDLMRHQRSVHGNQIRCLNPECGRKFRRRDKMIEHYNNIHFNRSSRASNHER
ncbi:hypothetical protein BDD12DRAFT_840584 [Trichophaea hybrida]|nr:hypothetical protein BDD12DRAFT_840584 [Trichophaea hybrida]